MSAPSEILIRQVADQFNIRERDITGPTQCKLVIVPRQLVMWKLRDQGYTLQLIGKILNRHHTTVMSGLKAIEKKMGADTLKRKFSNLKDAA